MYMNSISCQAFIESLNKYNNTYHNCSRKKNSCGFNYIKLVCSTLHSENSIRIYCLLIFKGKRKLIYACCLFVFTRSVSLRQSSCPLKGGQIPWKNPCGGQSSNEAPTEVPPTISNDKEWMRDLYVVLMELNHNFTALKALYVSILFTNEYLKGHYLKIS